MSDVASEPFIKGSADGGTTLGAAPGLLIESKKSVLETGKVYKLLSSPGSVQLQSHGTVDARAANRGERAAIKSWSKSSRANFLRQLSQLDYDELDANGIPGMITLTYPNDWRTVVSTRVQLSKHWRAFAKIWEASWRSPLRSIWKLEFQKRGAPHLHFFTHVPVGTSEHRNRKYRNLGFRDWLSVVWADIVAHPNLLEYQKHLAAGTRVDLARFVNATNRQRITSYFYKHSDSGGYAKDYQHDAPAEWLTSGGTGRFWGYTGLKKRTSTTFLTEQEFVEARRILRKVSASKGYRSRHHRPESREVVDTRTGEVTTVRTKVRRHTFLRTARLHGGFYLSPDGEILGEQMMRAVRHNPFNHAEISAESNRNPRIVEE